MVWCTVLILAPLFVPRLSDLPASYKLWKAYLDERRESLKNVRIDNAQWTALNNAYERALIFLHKMPRIWLDYAEVLQHQALITKTRQTLDRALKSLPLTQHERIWKVYLPFIRAAGVPEMAVRVYRRYLKLDPGQVEEYIDYLVTIKNYDEAARRLAEAINDDNFQSQKGKTQQAMWLELTEMCSLHAKEIKTLKVERIIRSGITRFSEHLGRLWVCLANYYTHLGQFEMVGFIFFFFGACTFY